MNKNISVAMATYNGEKYIRKQLESILAQTVVPDEIIIIDDNSTDCTAEIIKDFISNNNLLNWKLNINKKNIGYKRNFYNCISQTTGDYIFLADQDDEWHPEKIYKMINVINVHKNILTLSSGVEFIDENSSPIPYICSKNYYNCDFLYLKRPIKNLEFFDLAYIGKRNISPGCATMITKELVDLFLDSYQFEMPHDWYLNMLAAAKNGCAYTNEKLVRYRRHSSNAIGTNTGTLSGIKLKTRTIRIDDYASRLRALKLVIKIIDTKITKDLEEVLHLNKMMIEFYKKPSLKKLYSLRKTHNYFELAKKRVRVWEYIIAINLDIIIIKLLC